MATNSTKLDAKENVKRPLPPQLLVVLRIFQVIFPAITAIIIIMINAIYLRITCNVSLIICHIIKAVSQRLKPGKTDPVLCVTSHFFGSIILYDILLIIMKSYFIHGHVSDLLLISTLVPIVKDTLADTTSSNIYCSVAISSLVMEIFDWVII